MGAKQTQTRTLSGDFDLLSASDQPTNLFLQEAAAGTRI